MIGTTVSHYVITAKLGAGGMGEVFLAEDTRLERKAAIKFPPIDVAKDPERRHRFLKEAQAASALNHPNVCVIYDVGETDDGLPFIAMEFIEGGTLDHVLVKRGRLPIAEVVDLAVQVADALDAAHSNRIVHRDIKPANISLNERGQVKVLDFGLAKRMATETHDAMGSTATMQQTQDGCVVGTPRYMSPEQALGKPVDHRSDLFSLGVVLYELMTDQPPFGGKNFGEILNNIVHSQPTAIARLNYDAPPELERITLKCLQKSADRRYQSARELMVDLRNLARELEHGVVPGGSMIMGRGDAFQAVAAGRGVAPVAEPFSIEKLKTSDLLLNYAAIDDYPLQDGKPGWVSQLHRNLEVRMEQLSGEKVQIGRLPEDVVSPAVEAELLEHVHSAKAMISVVSPPFVNSSRCQREVEHFWLGAERTGGRFIKDKSRLFKVLKTSVADQQMPRPLVDIFSPLSGFEFFELDADTGRVREFDETFGPTLKQRFFERVYDLAYDGCQVLNLLKQLRASEVPQAANPHQQRVYLATTTSDVSDERDRIKRELLERGHTVLPEAPLPMLSKDVENVVRECLAQCTIAVHLLGQRYGVTPEDSSESIQALQVRLTADRAFGPALQRLIWMPGGDEIVDERQRAFVLRVQEDPALHHRAEVIEGNLNLLKKDLIRRLAPPEEKPKAAIVSRAATSSGGAPKVYLICDRKDEAAVEGLEDYLFAEGLEVMLPAFDGDDADAAALHQDNLLTCDAVLVYYGAAPKAWVDIKLRELLKATGYGRPAPIGVQAVYVAPPDDRRKERFQSHQAGVIRQPGEFEPSAELDTFVSQIQGVCS
jgi:serine/threonine protein kinase